MAKVDLAAELAAVEPETGPRGVEAARPARRPAAAGGSARKGKGRPSKADQADAAAILAEAKAQAEAERAEAAEAVGLNGGDQAPKLSKAERQRLRRITLRHVAVEVTIMHGAKLDRLAQVHGSQRAAIEAAIDQLYRAEVDE